MKKKVLVLVTALLAVVFSAKAEVEFAYEAGADLVSAYIWRGMYNGGLSLQPEGLVGFDAKDGAIQFRAGAWANIGASDWKFRKDGVEIPDVYNPNTYFVPEVDFIASITAYGASDTMHSTTATTVATINQNSGSVITSAISSETKPVRISTGTRP